MIVIHKGLKHILPQKSEPLSNALLTAKQRQCGKYKRRVQALLLSLTPTDYYKSWKR